MRNSDPLFTRRPALAFLSALGAASVIFACAAACGEAPDPQIADGCTYGYNGASTQLKWTAYKFTDKVGVGGTFKKYSVEGAPAATTARSAVAGLKFKVDALSVDSGVADRDNKIAEHFFGTMSGGGTIRGQVKSVDPDGKGVVTIEFNGQSRDVPVTYTLTDNVNLEVKGSLDVNDWAAGESLKALNKVCEELHTGADGASVLWPDVVLQINTVLERDCAE
jgi:polyisoprenoid-binding protein YceI